VDEITAEYSLDALTVRRPLEVRPRVTVACKTDLGRVRDNNEDKFEFYLPEEEAVLANRGLTFVVCDGMGGHEAGQIASELATKTFLDVYYHHPSEDVVTACREAVRAANRYVLDVAHAIPSRRGMGTTLSALVLLQREVIVTHVGDSRVYRLREGVLAPLTMDHTWVQQALVQGEISREEAEHHPYRNVLMRAIGTEADVACDVTRYDLRAGDIYLLCSDGLTGEISEELIAQRLSELGPSEAAWKLVGDALAAGGRDNCTVLIVRVDALEGAGTESAEVGV
jgi:protein phosphatase